MLVKNWMSKDVVTVDSDDSMQNAIYMLQEKNIKILPVVEKGNILVSKVSDTCKTIVHANTHLLLFGGEPLPEERHIYWNFVSHDKDKIEKAKAAWKSKTFPMMKDDTTYIPLPGL